MKKETKQKALSFLEAAAILLLAYPAGILVGIWFSLGCSLNRIKILHPERLPENLENCVLAGNHPSPIDPFFIAGLLFWHWLLYPLKFAPLIVADRKNFYNSKWLRFFRPVMIPIDRGDIRKEALALLKLKKEHRPKIIFPEGGRTFKGKPGEWLYCEKGNNTNGGRIRPLKSGVGLIVQKSGATVIPIAIVGSHKIVPNSRKHLWTRFNFWEKVTLNIGEPVNFDPALPREEVTQQIALKLLSLINEAL